MDANRSRPPYWGVAEDRMELRARDQGQAQADTLANKLSKVKFAAVYTSPLERAMETAKPLAAATCPGLV